MEVHFESHNIRELEADFDRVPNTATRKVGRAVESTAKDGNRVAQAFAVSSSGDHGKWYPERFTAESKGAFGLTWSYGPEYRPKQGKMSFEFGSRNQPPHLDLAKSADLIAPVLQKRVGDAIGESFDGN